MIDESRKGLLVGPSCSITDTHPFCGTLKLVANPHSNANRFTHVTYRGRPDSFWRQSILLTALFHYLDTSAEVLEPGVILQLCPCKMKASQNHNHLSCVLH